MSQRLQNQDIVRAPAPAAVIIETARHTAGLAVQDGRDVQFFASHSLFQALDGQRFRSVRALERAVSSLEAAIADQRRTRDSRGQIWRSWEGPQLDGNGAGQPEAA
ncbi:hypothetical protein UAJ10_28555 [Nitrospirillum sp. BR 11164]|uniref:hypothetical protein n=1 Tax=Nitrospirillum sp. BR 11164 TaxID=3104324 RepID=UPI002AFDD533|nr:hypothetical protein [Nitrospirillum sp. BR 11164]MEA1652953.1 hypothetical protein [Nitrospirillum sp. BR 11164]